MAASTGGFGIWFDGFVNRFDGVIAVVDDEEASVVVERLVVEDVPAGLPNCLVCLH